MAMSGYKLLYFYSTSHVSRLKQRLVPFVPISVLRKYTQSIKENYEHHAEEKAPTTAEEFMRVADEMAEDKEHLERVAEEKDRQGFASQTVDKAMEAATMGDSNFDSVKESLKEPLGKGNFHKTGDDSDDLLKNTHKSK
ncbi:PREDICTED: uncharacterized protein LOC109215664 [Nicotiana attenuata]|uniref:Uncharacterized protein n=1 Tax=Nicotiana attenuata TaxID=49451 RepID=A0A1J6KMS4_NICAT|nr:PREDICTED: uncharacterized protein LOC109215664 [Nicotiana attenuata]OIT26168.1 hypothetical protein A4A49_26127 [Nicotiana attenuata]